MESKNIRSITKNVRPFSSIPNYNNFQQFKKQKPVLPSLFKGRDEEEIKQMKREFIKRKNEKLTNKITYEKWNVENYNNTISPNIHFLKLLAIKCEEFKEHKRKFYKNKKVVPRLKIWIPDTIIFNENEMNPFWIYSNEDGLVYRTDNINARTVNLKFCNYANDNEIVAVSKRSQGVYGNDLNLLTKKEVYSLVNQLFSQRDSLIVIQRFIKCSGPKAFIIRVHWSKNCKPIAYIITNKSPMFNSEKLNDISKFVKSKQCDIIETKKGRFLNDTLDYIENLVNYLNKSINLNISEMVVDFTKDEVGIWWFLNVKHFMTVSNIEKINIKKITHLDEDENFWNKKLTKKNMYQKYKNCKYCELEFPIEELTKKLTIKMIIQLDKHLIFRGKNFKYLERGDTMYLDTNNLYEWYLVCKICFKLYSEVEDLIKVYTEFSKFWGLNLNLDKNDQIISITTLNRKPADILEFEKELNKKIKKNINTKNNKNKLSQSSYLYEIEKKFSEGKIKSLLRYKWIFFLELIENIPENIDQTKNYHLEMNVLKTKIKINLDFNKKIVQKNKKFEIIINKLRRLYFFVHSRNDLVKYLNKQINFKMYLFCDGEKIGNTEFDLSDFTNDKVTKREFYKMMDGPIEKIPILSWGIKLSMGIIGGEEIKISTLGLHNFNEILIPSQYYFSYEALTEDWIKLIDKCEVSNYKQLQNESLSISNLNESLKNKDEKTNDELYESKSLLFDNEKDFKNLIEKELKKYELNPNKKIKNKKKLKKNKNIPKNNKKNKKLKFNI